MNSILAPKSPSHRCGLLAAGSILLWLILAGPAYWVAGGLGLEGLTYSAFLCTFPGCVLFLVIPFFGFAQNKAFAFLAGSGLRMFAVLVATLLLHEIRADLGLRQFLSWLVVFYSVTLLIETLLIVGSLDGKAAGSGAKSEGVAVS